MHLDLSQFTGKQIYHTLTQTIVPRPIAWVLTRNQHGSSWNLAPFSYFNAVASRPPLIMLSIGIKGDGALKDTRANILREREFVIHIADTNLAAAVDSSSAPLPDGESEVTAAGLSLVDFENNPLPRIDGAPVAMYCRLWQYQEIGDTPQGLILGEVKNLWIDDSLATADEDKGVLVDSAELQPLSRLGKGEYAELGEIFRATSRKN